jgi:hypothetical protein
LLPAAVADSISMLTLDEKQFLYWLTSEYFSGIGAIIDAGCFIGGSTLAYPVDTDTHQDQCFLMAKA